MKKSELAATIVVGAFFIAVVVFNVLAIMGCGATHPADPKLHEAKPWKFYCDDGRPIRLKLSQNDIQYHTTEVYDHIECVCGETATDPAKCEAWR